MTERLLDVPVTPQQRTGSESPVDPLVLLAAADLEADALADRLHDGALQALVVARYATDAAVRGGDPALARDAVQEALVALRRTVWLLRPRGGDGLCEALAELSKRLTAAGAAPLDLDLDEDAAARLAPAARALAYRFVQAAVTDAAAAGSYAVRLVRDGSGAALSVAGGALSEPDGWSARAAAFRGSVETPADGVSLRLPLSSALHDSDPEGDR